MAKYAAAVSGPSAPAPGRWTSKGRRLAVAALAGGTAGSYFGSSRLPPQAIKRLLAVVLTIAGFKLIFS